MTDAEYDQVRNQVFNAIKFMVMSTRLKITTNIQDDGDMGSKAIGFVNGVNNNANKILANLEAMKNGTYGEEEE